MFLKVKMNTIIVIPREYIKRDRLYTLERSDMNVITVKYFYRVITYVITVVIRL